MSTCRTTSVKCNLKLLYHNRAVSLETIASKASTIKLQIFQCEAQFHRFLYYKYFTMFDTSCLRFSL